MRGDLSHVRDHLSLILDGLRSMEPDETTVPGMIACEGVQLVSDAVTR